MKEFELEIDTEKIAKFFYDQLIQRGYAPTEDEVEELADITFDYLLSLGIAIELEDEE